MNIHDNHTTRWTAHGRDMFIEAVALAYSKILENGYKDNVKLEYFTNSDSNICNDYNKKVWNSSRSDPSYISDFIADMLLDGENLKNNEFFIINVITTKEQRYRMRMDMDIEVRFNLRPCAIYDDYRRYFVRRGLFHAWSIEPNNRGISTIVGIVEYEDGDVETISPNLIHFLDEKFDSYIWDEKGVKDE